MDSNQSLVNYTCQGFVEVLASKAPVPGGGGASAMVGALGAALGNMVCGLTKGNNKYKEVDNEITVLMSQITELQENLLELVDKDAEVFQALSAAYKNKDDKEKLEECLLSAAQVPLEIMGCCGQCIVFLQQVKAIGNRMAISDVGAGGLFLTTALKGASLNVFINTSMMKDRKIAEEINKKTEATIKKYEPMGEEIFSEIKKQLIK